MKQTFSLFLLDSFGDVAAEDDAVLEYFLSTNAVEKIRTNKAFLVLGRKGTGKTAIVRHFSEQPSGVLSQSLNLRGYPWSVHANRIDYGASDIEAYVSSWKYLIAVELATLVMADKRTLQSKNKSALENFLKDNYGGTHPKISEILMPSSLRLTKFSLQPSIMGNQLGGIDLERGPKDHKLGLELNALTSSIIDAVMEISQESQLEPLSLHFDELDQGMQVLDAARNKMIIGLIIAAREIKRDSEKVGGHINPVIYLRTDVWEELQFSDKNKISKTHALNLGWDSSSL
ncbi:P-loop ATPase, Sll1717 family, partial [Teichococcus rhizosphaerae]|uniref:P-loop ATPase, Sll1717 family n=1 Tax=Teichococcus rhizosphaerae TaxID=1335062 RepID=UPI001145BCBF